MGNSFGCLCSDARYKGRKKRNIIENNSTSGAEHMKRKNEEVIEISDKVKEDYLLKAPQLYDGYMKVCEFKQCEKFLTQSHDEILNTWQDPRRPDIVYGYITDYGIVDDPVVMKQRQKCSEEILNDDSMLRFGINGDCLLEDGKSTTTSVNNDIIRRNDMKYMDIEELKTDTNWIKISQLETTEKKYECLFSSLPNLSDVKQMSLIHNCNTGMKSAKSCKIHKFSNLQLKISRRNSQQSESSTDSGQMSGSSSFSETGLKQFRNERYFCSNDCPKCRSVYMEYMVEVYEPLIVRQIKVSDVIDILHLPVLDYTNKDRLLKKQMQSPHDAMKLLIRMIKQSQEPGKWQCFYDAIAKSEFTYISMLLQEETEDQYDYSTEVLSLIKSDIKSRIYLPEFLDKVFERKLVTEAEKDEANSLPDIEAKTYILDRIDKHLPDWNLILVEVLTESLMDDLADLFKLVSQRFADTIPKQKEWDDKSLRRAIKKRRKNIMKIAHGSSYTKGAITFQAKRLHSFTGGIERIETLNEIATTMEKCVDELKICLQASESNDSETTLQELICEQNKLNIQQEYICSEFKKIRKDISEMKDRLNEILISVGK